MSIRTLLLGASGETGKEVLKHLLQTEDVSKVILVGRRKLEDIDDNKVEQRVVDFDNLKDHAVAFNDADVAICCLGTTRGKAGKEGFVKVDHDYVVESANKLKEAGCQDFHLVSSKGANPNAFFLYPQTKGKCEEAVKGIGFNRVSIYRPGLLMCDRTEQRTGEKIIRGIASWVDGSSKWSIRTEDLAKAIVKNMLRPMAGDRKTETLEHGDIMKILT